MRAWAQWLYDVISLITHVPSYRVPKLFLCLVSQGVVVGLAQNLRPAVACALLAPPLKAL